MPMLLSVVSNIGQIIYIDNIVLGFVKPDTTHGLKFSISINPNLLVTILTIVGVNIGNICHAGIIGSNIC